MSAILRGLRAASVILIAASPLAAQEHAHPTGEKLGTVHFVTSCAPAVAPQFDRAMALLHSFEFGPAIRGFTDVLAADSTCSMARWGIALSRWGNPMSATIRSNSVLETGRQAALDATRAGANATPRERAYIAAVSQLYADYPNTTQRVRVLAYEKAMSDVATANISDPEATIFYALSMIGAALPSDKTYANQLRAGSMLEAMWKNQPDHPGLAHYIIHAYDVPALAPQAKAAAQQYAGIAPSAAHALHMPSHTFTRVGLWEESVNTNLKSVDAAKRDGQLGEMLHASDYAVYAYLQMRNDSAAKTILDGVPALVAKYDVNAVAGAANGASGMFAVAAIPARYALERREWREAAELPIRSTAFPQTDAITHFARALGAAYSHDRVRAKVSIDSLKAISDRIAASGDAYWAEQVAIQHLEASAALYLSEGRNNEAIVAMREACTREDATEKAAVTPGPIVPAHELVGDMFLQLKQPREALANYRQSLVKEPNRYRSLYGAMKAAEAVGDHKAHGEYEAQLEKLTGTKPR